MSTQATYQDAELILKLYELRREEKLRAARAWFASSFHAQTFGEAMEKFPPGSEQNAYFRMVASYWEMAASFVVRGILNQELFFENHTELLFVWERAKNVIFDFREIRKNPTLYANLEKVAAKHIQWLTQSSPGAYEKFQAMVNPGK